MPSPIDGRAPHADAAGQTVLSPTASIEGPAIFPFCPVQAIVVAAPVNGFPIDRLKATSLADAALRSEASLRTVLGRMS